MARKILRVISATLIAATVTMSASNAYAIPVEDSGAYAKFTKQINELKKQLQELQKIAGETLYIKNKLGDMSAGGMTPDAWIMRGKFLGQCLAPELMNFRLPDGVRPRFVNLCDAVKSAEQILMPNDNEVIDGEEVTGAEQARHVKARRDEAFKRAVLSAYGAARQAQATAEDSSNAANTIIERSNQATTLDNINREGNRASALILMELQQIRALLAKQLEMDAARESRFLPIRRLSGMDIYEEQAQ